MTTAITFEKAIDYCIKPLLVEADVKQLPNKREILSLLDNQTPSYIPSLFLDNKRKDLCKPITDVFKGTFSDLPSDELVVELEEDIRDHIEMRFQLFFQQLLLTFKTGLKIEKFKTYLQGGIQNKKGYSYGLVEAHSNTLPSLSFSKTGEASPYIYAVNSSIEKTWNATVKLPDFVNKVDSQIDDKTNDCLPKTFRKYCVSLLNKNASGEINPETGLKAFSKKINTLLKSLIEAHEGEKKAVLKHYYFVAKSYLKQTENVEFFRKLTFNFRTPILMSYEGLSQMLSSRVNYEGHLWTAFEQLQDRCISVIGKSIQHPSTLVKYFVLKLSLKTAKHRVIDDAIQKIVEGNAPGAATQKHVRTCMKSEEIQNVCVSYLNSRKEDKIERELERFLSSEGTVHSSLLKIKQLILDCINQKKVKNIEWMVLSLIRNSFSLTKEASTVDSHSFFVQQFLSVNHAWADNQVIGPQFLKHLDALMQDKKTCRKGSELIDRITFLKFV